MIALDTNLLIYAHRARLAEHSAAQHAIERAAAHVRGWGFALATVSEFWSVVTHPSSLGRPSLPGEARAFIERLCDAGARVWVPGPGFPERLVQLAADLEIRGPRIFDLQIALTVFANGASEIWSHDASFVKLPGVRVLDPL